MPKIKNQPMIEEPTTPPDEPGPVPDTGGGGAKGDFSTELKD